MNADATLDALAEACGILPAYVDLWGTERLTTPETKRAFLRANGLSVDSDAVVAETLAAMRAEEAARFAPREIVATEGAPLAVSLPGRSQWWLSLDSGGVQEGQADDRLFLPGLPAGIHRLTVRRGGTEQTTTLLVAPPTLPMLDRPAWGVTGALYGLRSERDLGLGDYEDMARLAEGFGRLGAGFLGVNPVHNWGWAAPGTISPYSPSHRGFLNTMHIALDRIPGLEASPKAAAIAADARAMAAEARSAETVDYPSTIAALRAALPTLYGLFRDEANAGDRSAFASFCRERGETLDRFARFETLSETHGADWRGWPDALKSTDAPDAQRADPGRQDFHKWLQWVADRQLADAQARACAAGMTPGLYLDLAVGARRGGAETWCEQDGVALGVSVGAPPDHLSPGGQNWGLAGFSPIKARNSAYRGFRAILRENMRHAGILRIDHILGLSRSYWLPDGGGPGGYIRQPFEALLAVVAIEAARAGCIVVGEDLGLVPDGFRETMARRGLYGYSVLQYERDSTGRFRKPHALRPQTLACFGTHDTPTLRGYWTGCDIGWWRRMGWIDETTARNQRAGREMEKHALYTLETGDMSEDANAASPAEIAARIHGTLARAPVAMVSVQLDDMLGVEEAQNLPGTVDEHPNWRRRCAQTVDEIATDPVALATADLMRQSGRAGPKEETT